MCPFHPKKKTYYHSETRSNTEKNRRERKKVMSVCDNSQQKSRNNKLEVKIINVERERSVKLKTLKPN